MMCADQETPNNNLSYLGKNLSMKKATTPPEINSEDKPLLRKLAGINAKSMDKYVKIKLQILGEVSFKAVPRKVTILCEDCGAHIELDLLNDLQLLAELIISQKNRKKIYGELLTRGCKGADGEITDDKEHIISYEESEFMDYSLLLVRDLMSYDKKFEVQNYNPKWIHVINQPIPRTKKISMVGKVVYDGRPSKLNIELIATKLEPLEDELENFKVTIDDKQNFSQYFQDIIPIKQLAPSMVGRDDVKEALLLSLHSPPYIPDIHKNSPQMRGLLRMIFIGDTKTNKSTAAKDITNSHIGGYYSLGDFISAETGSRTGILYTIDNDKKSLTWGSIVLNDMGIVVLDGLHSLHQEEMKSMREVLEQLMVTVRRSVSGDALARTRIIGIINPNRPMRDYTHNCLAIRDTWVFNDQVDITRWDLIIPFNQADVDNEDIIKTEPETRPIPDKIFIRHVQWAWSRSSQQIKYPENIKQLIIDSYHELSTYETSEIPLVHLGFKFTILRFSVAYACLKHSTDDSHEKVIVKETHVKMATEFLKLNFKRLELEEYVKEIEGECFSEEFLDIFAAIDDIGIKILLELSKNKTNIRKLAKDFDVNKSTIESRFKIFKEYSIIDTSSRKTKLTSFGLKILKSILKFKQEYQMSGVPEKPDNKEDISLLNQTPDTGQGEDISNLSNIESQSKLEVGDFNDHL
jgi:hypothetical protein